MIYDSTAPHPIKGTLYSAFSALLASARGWHMACVVFAVPTFIFHCHHAASHGLASESATSLVVGTTCVWPAALAMQERWIWLRKNNE